MRNATIHAKSSYDPSMAMTSARRDPVSPEHRRTRALLGAGMTLALIVAVLAVAVLAFSGVTLASDPTALARVTVQPLGGTIEHVRAYGPDGRRVPLAIDGGRLTPLKRLAPGEQVTVDVEVRRPGWLSWALGSERNEQLTLRAPAARVTERWMTVPSGSEVRVSFDQPVSAVSYGSGTDGLTHHTLSSAQSSVSLGPQASTGAIEIAAAPRPWERLGAPMQVSWFPPSQAPVMVSFPAAGARISPATPIDLTFSKPVSEVLGSARPQLSPSTPGSWREANSHTLVFTPSGLGAALDSQLQVRLPRAVAVTTGGSGLRTTNQIEWTRAARLDAAPASAPRRSRLPAGRMAAVGRRRGAHAERGGAGSGRTSRAAASTGAIRTRHTSCRRCGARTRRPRSPRAR